MRKSGLIVHLPNLITLGRLVLVPAIIVAIVQSRWSAAFAIFLIAGVSDAIDGFLAKRLDLRTELGAHLDPLADKALIVSIYVALVVRDVLPPWITILVVSRDAMIVGAIMISWLMARPVAIRPLSISKLNTAAQIAFAAYVLAAKAFGWPLDDLFRAAMWGVAALTAASAVAYLLLWFAHMTGEETER